MHFSKMIVNGNRILIIDSDSFFDSGFDESNIVQKILGKEFGVACDQAVIYKPLEKNNNTYSVVFYNDDGSCAEMCGNGICCLGRFLNSHTGKTKFKFLVDKKTIQVDVDEYVCRADLGKPDFDNSMLVSDATVAIFMIKNVVENFLLANNMPCFDAIFSIGISLVDFGNPHVVLLSDFEKAKDCLEEIMLNIGSKIENLKCFKNRVNVGFGYVSDNSVRLFVWERGSGYTGACGSGSCAAVSALHKMKNINKNANYKIIQKSGSSSVYISEDYYVTLETSPIFCFNGDSFCI